MCNFITATLPAGADTPPFRAAVEAAGLSFAPLHNRHVQAQLHPAEGYFHATRAHCDCSSELGGGPTQMRQKDQRQRLRAKGWSEAKIAAWERTQGPRPRSREDVASSGDPTREHWLRFLDEVLTQRHVHYVGLLQHQYRSCTADEHFEITRERRTLAEVAARAFQWRSDVLYEIVAG